MYIYMYIYMYVYICIYTCIYISMFVDLSDIPLMIYTFQADMIYAQTPQWLESRLVDRNAMASKNKHAN